MWKRDLQHYSADPRSEHWLSFSNQEGQLFLNFICAFYTIYILFFIQKRSFLILKKSGFSETCFMIF